MGVMDPEPHPVQGLKSPAAQTPSPGLCMKKPILEGTRGRRVFGIASGHRDGNDADHLSDDLMHKLGCSGETR